MSRTESVVILTRTKSSSHRDDRRLTFEETSQIQAKSCHRRGCTWNLPHCPGIKTAYPARLRACIRNRVNFMPQGIHLARKHIVCVLHVISKAAWQEDTWMYGMKTVLIFPRNRSSSTEMTATGFSVDKQEFGHSLVIARDAPGTCPIVQASRQHTQPDFKHASEHAKRMPRGIHLDSFKSSHLSQEQIIIHEDDSTSLSQETIAKWQKCLHHILTPNRVDSRPPAR